MSSIIAPLGASVAHGDSRLPERFWAKTQISANGCWEWTAQIAHHGYARYSFNGRTSKAHRVAYEQLVGPIPAGLVIDHLCRVRHCVNPAHLEPVTNAENLRRGEWVLPTRVAALRTHCRQGHAYAEHGAPDVRGGRRCRACQRQWSTESRARKALAQAGGAR